MKIIETQPLPSSQFMKDFLSKDSIVETYFTYKPLLKESWENRLKTLSVQNHVNREGLVGALSSYNKRFNPHVNVMENIEKLTNNDVYVVIGGQQAGMLTGPLLVIHKVVTLLKLADKMRAETGKEMIPVFWIASEDHDFAEVNHVFAQSSGGEIHKVKLSEKGKPKASVSEVTLGKDELNQFVQEFFAFLEDSPYQEEIKQTLYAQINASTTLSDLFAFMIGSLFGKYGLILVDSSDPFIRKLETPIFQRLIDHDLENMLIEHEQTLIEKGYQPQLENLQGNAHFFLHLDGERHLMMRHEGQLVSKNGKHRFTKEELQEKLRKQPEIFSSNVVSRPIMQEFLFPVAAFVGGPGEISYWAQLKPVFEFFNLEMPIVFPRLTFTWIERNIANYLEAFNLSFEQACYEWEAKREAWLGARGVTKIAEEFEKFKCSFDELYESFLDKICTEEPWARNLGKANRERIIKHMDFLQKKTFFAVEQRHEASLEHWLKIKQSLYPMNKPQERVYNILELQNKYGPDLIDKLLTQDFDLSVNHKLIYI